MGNQGKAVNKKRKNKKIEPALKVSLHTTKRDIDGARLKAAIDILLSANRKLKKDKDDDRPQ